MINDGLCWSIQRLPLAAGAPPQAALFVAVYVTVRLRVCVSMCGVCERLKIF